MSSLRFQIGFFATLVALCLLFIAGYNPSASVQAQGPLPPRDTPTPVPPSTQGDDDKDSRPLEMISLRLDGCDLTCNPNPISEIQAKVQLIHEGSDWIAETRLSNTQSTQVEVPYPGTWKVWLISAPELTTSGEVPEGFVQTAELKLPDSFPSLLGTVQTGSGTQVVDCPANCQPMAVGEEETANDSPDDLPKTGDGEADASWVISIMVSLLLVIILGSSFFIQQRRRSLTK